MTDETGSDRSEPTDEDRPSHDRSEPTDEDRPSHDRSMPTDENQPSHDRSMPTDENQPSHDRSMPTDEDWSPETGADDHSPEPGTDDRSTETGAAESADAAGATDGPDTTVPPDVRKYERFKKMDGAAYDRVNEFLRDRTYVTAREWAIARLCADFRTETGVEMTKIGENLPELVPFMTDTYTPQAVNQARSSFEEKVTKAGATFLYGAMSGFFTAEELDEVMYEVTEVAKFLLEVEGVDLAAADELEAEDRVSEVMREVRAESARLRAEEVECPHCGRSHEV